MDIDSGSSVVIVLQEPKEKVWGVLRGINDSGVYVRGCDLEAFDDLVRSVSGGGPVYGLGEQFLPMWRVVRVALDEADGDIPSLREQFEKRTGRKLADI